MKPNSAAEEKLKPAPGVARRRKVRFLRTRLRELRMIVKALLSTGHPLLVHFIPTRRCNLSCTYCNEFDDFSLPVPLEELKRRLDALAEWGASVITVSGGEPMLHPQLDDIIRHVRRRGAIAGLITNGYLLTTERIERLNRAGLEHLQISIDNTIPDEVSKKSLKVLDQKLVLLSRHAVFQVNINSVLGSGVKDPEDALAIAHRAVELGFTSTVGIIHDNNGQLKPLGPREVEIFEEIMALGKRSYSRLTLSSIASLAAANIPGVAARARVTCMSVRTVWFTGARNSADIPAFLWHSTLRKSAAANISRRNPAPRFVLFPAFSKLPL